MADQEWLAVPRRLDRVLREEPHDALANVGAFPQQLIGNPPQRPSLIEHPIRAVEDALSIVAGRAVRSGMVLGRIGVNSWVR